MRGVPATMRGATHSRASYVDYTAAIFLVAVSFFAFVVGTIFRKWPEKVQERVEDIDGSIFLMTPEAHRQFIEVAGYALVVMSFAALIGAAVMM